MLKSGADPNFRPSLLAEAINYCSIDLCQLLLEHGANPNSEFEVQLQDFSKDSAIKSRKLTYGIGKEAALHAAYRIGSIAKINLLLSCKAKRDLQWIGDSLDDIEKKYNIDGPDIFKIHPHLSSFGSKMSPLECVIKCREFVHSMETKEIVESLTKSVKLVTSRVSEVLNLNFESSLSGSYAENTKCFAPDEFDFTLDCLTRLHPEAQVDSTLRVYACVDAVIRNSIITMDSSTGSLSLKSLLYGDKISYLHFVWTSKQNGKLDITVDLAVCHKDVVIKRARHYSETPVGLMLKSTRHILGQAMIRKLPVHTRNGFILAKAVRIASIAQPDNIESFELEATVKSDDVISSFILKACLFGKKKRKRNSLDV